MKTVKKYDLEFDDDTQLATIQVVEKAHREGSSRVACVDVNMAERTVVFTDEPATYELTFAFKALTIDQVVALLLSMSVLFYGSRDALMTALTEHGEYHRRSDYGRPGFPRRR